MDGPCSKALVTDSAWKKRNGMRLKRDAIKQVRIWPPFSRVKKLLLFDVFRMHPQSTKRGLVDKDLEIAFSGWTEVPLATKTGIQENLTTKVDKTTALRFIQTRANLGTINGTMFHVT